MNRHTQHRHAVIALFLFGSTSALACSEDGDPGTPSGGLQVGQAANGQGSSPSGEGEEDPSTDPSGPAGGTTAQGGAGSASGTGGTSSKGGTGGTSSKGGTGGTSSKGGTGGSSGSSSKGGTGGTGGSSAKGGTGGTSSKGGSGGTGGTSSKGGTGGTGGDGEYFSIADFFMPDPGQETACSQCLRTKCAGPVASCGNLAEGGECYTLAECISTEALETDTSLDCAFSICGAAQPTVVVNGFLTCLGDNCATECLATPGFTTCER